MGEVPEGWWVRYLKGAGPRLVVGVEWVVGEVPEGGWVRYMKVGG